MTINIIRKRGSTIKTSPPVPCKAKSVTQVLSSGQWKDETCFILGGGPSMKNLDFNLLRRYKTIGINKSVIKYPTNIVYSMDHTFYDMIRNKENDPVLFEAWKNFKGIKVFLRDNHFQYDESVYVVESLPKCISLSLANGIFSGNNSGCGALMLAVALGCKKIGLFGYDFCVDKNQTHWHNGYKDQRVESLERNLVNFRKCVEEWAEPLKQMGIQAVNLSNHSALQQYPQMSLENFLKI